MILFRIIQRAVNKKSSPVGNNSVTSQRLKAVRERLNLSQAKLAQHLRVSRSYINKLELSQGEPSEKVLKILRVLEQGSEYGAVEGLAVERQHNPGMRYIPLLAWVEAVALEDFESLPPVPSQRVLSDCPDVEAFAVTLGADCMQGEFVDGDVLTVMPLVDLRTGCLALASLHRGGLIFRRWTPNDPRSANFRLTATKAPYRPIDLEWDDVRWIYPVYRVLKLVW